jgi:hypothetical protein
VTISLSTSPTYALAGLDRVTVSCSAGDFARLWLTAAPAASLHTSKLASSGTDATRALSGVTDSDDALKFNFDVGGEYVFTGQEYTRGVAGAQGGGFSGDPRAFGTEAKVGVEQVVKVHVGEVLSHQVGTPSHGTATLIVHVWDDTIRQTTLAVHGVQSPGLIGPTTPSAESAVRNSTVNAKVDAFVGVTAATMTSNVDALVSEMITDIANHLNNVGSPGGWHAAQDTNNDTEIEDLATAPGGAAGYARVARVLAARLRAHVLNGHDGASRYHTFPDTENVPIVDPPVEATRNTQSVALTWSALGDVWRAFESHRSKVAVHDVADGDNELTTSLDVLLDLHQAFMTELAKFAPTTPDGVQSAVVQMAQLGFARGT